MGEPALLPSNPGSNRGARRDPPVLAEAPGLRVPSGRWRSTSRPYTVTVWASSSHSIAGSASARSSDSCRPAPGGPAGDLIGPKRPGPMLVVLTNPSAGVSLLNEQLRRLRRTISYMNISKHGPKVIDITERRRDAIELESFRAECGLRLLGSRPPWLSTPTAADGALAEALGLGPGTSDPVAPPPTAPRARPRAVRARRSVPPS
jgi:hypothetical protein